ncbi:LapA family protein [Pelomonas sp. SE-A7]|uniref:LapA family protein n=1 Tax=Pelomonas sp. SE-A7 TaxID=3054953 RepID=UPI00259CB6CA|nr:LapA family protein [Pelomonas sp. SE-A7]MDM4765548.1 LapA family protein [Pelomonas sp. SE-A7]
MRLITWLLRAFLFFALFAFALNNQQEVAVHWFFGHEWRAPLVIVVLLVFGIGCALGVLSMVPAWWRHRRLARQRQDLPPETLPPGDPLNNNPLPRDGL